MTDTHVPWIVSMQGIAGVVITLVIAPTMEALGPRKYLLILLLPAGIPWLVQAFTPYLSLFYLGRVVSCLISAALGPVAAVLTAELSEPRIRGLLLSIEEITVALGQMAIYVMAHALPWDVATAVCAAPVILVALLTFFVPESPYWLIRRDRKEAAMESLKKLRSPTENVGLELQEITASIQGTCQITIRDQMKQLCKPQNYRPVLLLTAVFILRELGGQFVVFSYTVYLFRKAGVGLDAFTCTVLVGVVRLVFTVVAAAVVDRVGRRPLMIATSLACGVAEVVAAVFLLVDVPGSSWVPLAAVMVFVSAYGLGIGPIPWALLGELIPTSVRTIGCSLCNFNFSLFTFVISFAFPYLLDIGLGFAFLVFASANAMMTLLLYAFLPETRGQSLNDLENIFQPSQGVSDGNGVIEMARKSKHRETTQVNPKPPRRF
ncbi:facilitated trehalose transporter Tret1-like [Penaeus japonicus]|uniref:facilitated trehalose transporter Tret1-like n=1 Tax=Penaeus japonicus TaxID=27405 RepID=UPI001C70FD35|nr:facilitated trehalose transporter Tret1-like [Penaeus japonicus]